MLIPAAARLCSEHFISGSKSDDPTDPDFHPSVFPSAKSSHNQKTCVYRRRGASGAKDKEPTGDFNESDFSSSVAAAAFSTCTNDTHSSKPQDYNICLPGNGPQMFVQWETMSR